MSKGPRALGRVAEQEPADGMPHVAAAEPVDVGEPHTIAVASGAEHDDFVILTFLVPEPLARLREGEGDVAVGEKDVCTLLGGNDLIVPLGSGDVEVLRDNGARKVAE